jgi:hypothetical protein
VSVGQNHSTGARYEVFDYIAQSKYLEGPVTNQNYIQEENTERLNRGL